MADPDIFTTEHIVLQDGPYDGQGWEVRLTEYELHIFAPPPLDGSHHATWPEPYAVYRRIDDQPRFVFQP